jgi:hypothetical protein
MHIFIDESGNFLIPKAKRSRVSSITSLVIPDKCFDRVGNSYLSLRKTWGYGSEVKGSHLTETQIASTIALLRSYDVLVDVTWLNVGHHTTEGVDKYKITQANKILENVTEEHQKTLVKQLEKYRQRMLNLPNQLFLQAMTHIQHIKRILQNSTLYYSQRIPEELGNFVWVVDAKNNNNAKTPFEELWSTLLLPILDSNSPLHVLDEGDYSYLEKKYELPKEEMTEWRRARMLKESIGATDLKKLISEQLTFEDSGSNIGLQLVDIVSSAFSRAMNGTLKSKGWRHLGMLMVEASNPVVFDKNLDQNLEIEERHILVWQKIKSKLKPLYYQIKNEQHM